MNLMRFIFLSLYISRNARLTLDGYSVPSTLSLGLVEVAPPHPPPPPELRCFNFSSQQAHRVETMLIQRQGYNAIWRQHVATMLFQRRVMSRCWINVFNAIWRQDVESVLNQHCFNAVWRQDVESTLNRRCFNAVWRQAVESTLTRCCFNVVYPQGFLYPVPLTAYYTYP